MKEYFSSSSKIFVVLDLMVGETLYHRLKKGGRMTEPVARHYFHQIFRGVQHCHSMAVVIYDLRLDTILLDDDGGLKISEFGSARIQLDDVTAESSNEVSDFTYFDSNSGYIHHLPPEILLGKRSDGRKADIWSMGLILYGLVLGREVIGRTETSRERLLRKIDQLIESPMPTHFSKSLQALLCTTLIQLPNLRTSLEEMLTHSWMQWDDAKASHNPASVRTKGRRGALAGSSSSTSKPPKSPNVWEMSTSLFCNPMKLLEICGTGKDDEGGEADDSFESWGTKFEDITAFTMGSQDAQSSINPSALHQEH